jgi:hypothetical protein
MAAPKRATELTEAERKERNRLYKHNERHRDNNAYARAQRRAMQRVVKWFQQERAGTWARWLREEVEAERAKGIAAKKYKPHAGFTYAPQNCPHNGGEFAVGVTTACTLCGQLMGTQSVNDADRDELDLMIGGVRPEEL